MFERSPRELYRHGFSAFLLAHALVLFGCGPTKKADNKPAPTSDDVSAGNPLEKAGSTTTKTSVATKTATSTDTSTEAVVAATGDDKWVGLVFTTVLGRPPGPDELTNWVTSVGKDGRAKVAAVLVGCPEALVYALKLSTSATFVRDLSADPTWQKLIVSITTGPVETLKLLAKSPEYWIAGGSNQVGYTALLYSKVLGRGVDPQGAALWANRPQSYIADGVVGADEAVDRMITGMFANFLKRAPTPDDLVAWRVKFRGTAADFNQAIINVLQSEEFAKRAG